MRLGLLTTALTAFLSIHAIGQPLTIPASNMPDILQLHPDTAFRVLKERLVHHEQSGNKHGQASCLQAMGRLLFHLGSYSQSVDHLLQADKLYRSLHEPEMLAANDNILGTVYYYNQQALKARVLFDEALHIYKEKQNPSGMAETYALIGHACEKQLHYDSAYYFQQLALNHASLANDTFVKAKIYENIGSIYEDQQDYDSARYFFQLSLISYKQINRWIDQIEVLNNLGDTWSKTGFPAKGMSYAQEAAQLAETTGEKYQLQSAYRDIAQNFVALKQFDSAYYYLEKSRHLVQSIYSQENSYQISVLQTLNDMDKKNAEITHLSEVRSVNNLLIWSVIFVLILLGVVAALIINRQQMKIRTEKEINLGNTRIYETEKGLMQSELQRKQLEENGLKEQLELKGRQLSTHVLHLIQKNEVLEELKRGLADIIKDDKRDQKKQVKQLLQKINLSFNQDSYWDDFRMIFDKVHPEFLESLNRLFPSLTAGEIRLLTLLKMNLASNDMATLLGVTPDSLRVHRYRLKKKLGLNSSESLTAFIHSIGTPVA